MVEERMTPKDKGKNQISTTLNCNEISLGDIRVLEAAGIMEWLQGSTDLLTHQGLLERCRN